MTIAASMITVLLMLGMLAGLILLAWNSVPIH
jgi:hypothetical protein